MGFKNQDYSPITDETTSSNSSFTENKGGKAIVIKNKLNTNNKDDSLTNDKNLSSSKIFLFEINTDIYSRHISTSFLHPFIEISVCKFDDRNRPYIPSLFDF